LLKYVIFNADDFGASPGVNRGIVESHAFGVVTSASLMVTAPAAREAVTLAAEHPELSLGLHWVGDAEQQARAIRAELERQLDTFHELVGRPPTHFDSHHHLHRREDLASLFEELVRPLGVPLRGDGSVTSIGGFYAQWELGVTQPEYVSVDFLTKLLREEVGDGWTEISCHPGYADPDFTSGYAHERELEVATLTDPRVARAVDELGLELRSYADYARAAGR
jgi:chitin disaccharide deacetylase